MTKIEAIKILGLNEEFTLRDLENRFQALSNALYKCLFSAQEGDIKKAYRFLKDNKSFTTHGMSKMFDVDGLFEQSVNEFMFDKTEKSRLEMLLNSYEYHKETFLKSIAIFLDEIPKAQGSDEQLSMFSYPKFFYKYSLKIKEKTEKVIEKIWQLKGIDSYSEFETIVSNFLKFIEECYRELFLEFLKENGYNLIDAKWIFDKISLNIKCLISLAEFYDKLKTYISQKETEFNERINKWLFCLKLRYIEELNVSSDLMNEIFDQISKTIMEIYKGSLIFDEKVKNEITIFFQTLFKKSLDRPNFLVSLFERKTQEIRKLPGSLLYQQELREIYNELMKEYGNIDFHNNPNMREMVEVLLNEKVAHLLAKYNDVVENLKKLAISQPVTTGSQLLLALEKSAIDGESKELDISTSIGDGNILSSVDRINSGTTFNEGFLVYQGDNLSFLTIENTLFPLLAEGYTLKGVSIKGNTFVKIIPKGKGVSDFEPYVVPNEISISNDGKICFLSNVYDEREIDKVYEKFSKELGVACSNRHEILSFLYRNYGLQMIEFIKDLISLDIVIYDARFDELNAVISRNAKGNNRLFVGYMEDDGSGVLYSDNLCLLQCFCKEIYEVEPNSYITNKVPNSLKRYDGRLRFRY